MKFAHPLLSEPIEFLDGKINVLIIENQTQLSIFIMELMRQQNGEEGTFVLSEDFKPVLIEKKLELITDWFQLDINSRKLQNKLYAQIETLALGEKFYTQTMELLGYVETFLDDLICDVDYPIVKTKKIDAATLTKCVELRFDFDGDSLLRRVVDYFAIARNFLGITCFVLVNIKSYLSVDELRSLYKQIAYQKHYVILLENVERDVSLAEERVCIIDDDLCEIRRY
ncbi:MAG: type II-A CRISPR-associated protein Csn2 [Desulfitobacteriaceae bacterium]